MKVLNIYLTVRLQKENCGRLTRSSNETLIPRGKSLTILYQYLYIYLDNITRLLLEGKTVSIWGHRRRRIVFHPGEKFSSLISQYCILTRVRLIFICVSFEYEIRNYFFSKIQRNIFQCRIDLEMGKDNK